MRVLITGSRDWDDEKIIRQVLSRLNLNPETTVLVSGGCPKGADLMCEDFAIEYGWTVERHPADWEKYGKRAGFIRNYEMVQTGADICLAFIKNESKGATMTHDIAMGKGIPTYRMSVSSNNEVNR